MNNPFAFSNDLNAFRGAVAAEQQNYDHKVGILQSTQLAKRTKALNKAKAFIEKGEELTKQGLEAAAVPHLGKLTYKAGKSVYNRIRGRSVAQREAGDETSVDEASEMPSSSNRAAAEDDDAVQEVSNQGGGEIEMRNMASSGDADNIEMQRMTDVGGRTGTNPGATEEAERYDREGLGNERMTDEQMSNINERAGMRANDIDAPERPGQVRGNGVEDQDSLGSNSRGDNLGEDLAEDAGDVEESGASLAEGAGDVASGIGSGIEAAAGAASDAVAGGVAAAEGVASGLAEAAAATSWIPFLGEVLAGAAGIAGLASAGVGVYEEIAGGSQESQAEKIPAQLSRSQLPSASVAGGYIAPLQSSVQV